MTSIDLTTWLDEYFDARPQLERPSKTALGYETPRIWSPAMDTLWKEKQKLEAQLRIATRKLGDIASFKNPDTETMAQDALCEIEEIK